MYYNYLDTILQNTKGKNITILPHDCADVDAIISSILLSKLFDFFNIKNSICIIDKNIGKDTKTIMSMLGYDVKDFFVDSEDENREIFLVDHYKTVHKGNVLGVIDHHFTTSNINSKVYLYQESSATAYIIYKLMEAAGMLINRIDIILLAHAMLVDTSSFKSPKAISSEKEELIALCLNNNLNYEAIKESSYALTDIANMSIYEIIKNGLKKYDFCNRKIASSYVQIKGKLYRSILENVLLGISNIIIKYNIDMWIFIIFDMQNDVTFVYYITPNGVKEKRYDTILSRGKNIIPKVEEYFNKL